MKKKILIHPGYPKTATTTLQKKLFENMPKVDNDYGYVTKEENELLKNCLIQKSFPSKNSKIYKRLNNKRYIIFSREFFLSPLFRQMHKERLKQWEKELEINPNYPLYYAPYFFEQVFNNNNDVKVLIVIRNQPDLLYSSFVQAYPRLKKLGLEKNIRRHYFSDNHLKKDFYIYDFYTMVNKYSEVFGKSNINVLLYEDLKHDSEYFYQKLASILEVDKKIIKVYLEGKQENRKVKNNEGYYTQQKPKRSIKWLFRHKKIYRILRFLIKPLLWSDRIKKQVLNPVVYDNNVQQISYFKVEDEQIIHDSFKESNEKLSDEWGIDKDKMRKYGYID